MLALLCSTAIVSKLIAIAVGDRITPVLIAETALRDADAHRGLAAPYSAMRSTRHDERRSRRVARATICVLALGRRSM